MIYLADMYIDFSLAFFNFAFYILYTVIDHSKIGNTRNILSKTTELLKLSLLLLFYFTQWSDRTRLVLMEYQWWVLSLPSVISGRIGKVFYHNKPMFGGVDVNGGRVWHYDLFEFWGSLTAGGHSEDE